MPQRFPAHRPSTPSTPERNASRMRRHLEKLTSGLALSVLAACHKPGPETVLPTNNNPIELKDVTSDNFDPEREKGRLMKNLDKDDNGCYDSHISLEKELTSKNTEELVALFETFKVFTDDLISRVAEEADLDCNENEATASLTATDIAIKITQIISQRAKTGDEAAMNFMRKLDRGDFNPYSSCEAEPGLCDTPNSVSTSGLEFDLCQDLPAGPKMPLGTEAKLMQLVDDISSDKVTEKEMWKRLGEVKTTSLIALTERLIQENSQPATIRILMMEIVDDKRGKNKKIHSFFQRIICNTNLDVEIRNVALEYAIGLKGLEPKEKQVLVDFSKAILSGNPELADLDDRGAIYNILTYGTLDDILALADYEHADDLREIVSDRLVAWAKENPLDKERIMRHYLNIANTSKNRAVACDAWYFAVEQLDYQPGPDETAAGCR